MKPIIFLDMDGVLNGNNWNKATFNGVSPEPVEHFNRLIRQTGADVVLSTSWRYLVLKGTMTCKGFAHMLQTHGVVALNIIGTTESDESAPYNRGIQIGGYCLKNGIFKNYVVLDDTDDGIKDLHPFVHTNSNTGLTAEDAEKAKAILEAKQ